MLSEILFEFIVELFSPFLDNHKIPKIIRIFIASIINIPLVALFVTLLIKDHSSVGMIILMSVLIAFFTVWYILLMRNIIKSKSKKSNSKDALF